MSTHEVNTYDFKTNFSAYVAALKDGKYDSITVMNRNEPIGEFTLKSENKSVRFGGLEGRLSEKEIDWLTGEESDQMVMEMFEESGTFKDTLK